MIRMTSFMTVWLLYITSIYLIYNTAPTHKILIFKYQYLDWQAILFITKYQYSNTEKAVTVNPLECNIHICCPYYASGRGKSETTKRNLINNHQFIKSLRQEFKEVWLRFFLLLLDECFLYWGCVLIVGLHCVQCCLPLKFKKRKDYHWLCHCVTTIWKYPFSELPSSDMFSFS